MSEGRTIRAARWIFLIAGILGLIEIVPLYFMEGLIDRTQPPAITHPGFYYGFVGVALAWQIAFLIIARDPLRYLPLMPALFLEKLLYPAAIFTLYAQGRAPAQNLGTAIVDLVWFVLFVIVWAKLRNLDREVA
jgi:hypothetical protein